MTEISDETPSSQNLRDVLMGIRSQRGLLTPRVVVDEAADPMHPLHHRFEWDDAVAGDAYRLQQAASLLRVTYKTDVGSERVDLRAFWVTKGTEGDATSRYEPMEEVINNPMSRELMLRQMRRDWQSFKRRYQHMQEFVHEVRRDLDDDGEPQAG